MFIDTSNYVTGLSGTGIDTEETVNALMKTQRKKYDKLYQKKQKAQWKKASYLELNTQMSALRNKTFDMKLKSNFNVKKTTPSNASAVSIIASSTAVNGSMKMSISQLAAGAYKTTNFNLKGETLDADSKFKEATTLNINGTAIDVEAGMSASDVAKKINEMDGLTASYDSGTGRFFLSTSETGKDAHITMDESTAKALGMASGKDSSGNYVFSAIDEKGTNAKFTLNGAEFEESSNNFTINGMTFDLKETTSSEFTITTETDVDAIYNNIKDYVDSYNKLISSVYSKLNEKADREYPPLTETQKEDMKEDEITKWEDKAKKGILRNDEILSKAMSSIRSAFTTPVVLSDGSKMSMYNIGLDTGSYETNGQIIIDENKLKAAIAENPDKIVEFFTANGKADASQNGVFQKIQESLDTAMEDIGIKAGSTDAADENSYLGKLMTSYQKAMTNEKKRLEKMEKKYYEMYSSLETSIAKMSSQFTMFDNYTN